jgi:AraC-like DNA-binding protein
VRTDQSNPQLGQALDDNLGAMALDLAQTLDLRAREIVKLHRPARRPRPEQPRDTPSRRSASATRRSDIVIRQRQSPTEQLCSAAQEEIARLTEILRGQSCAAVMRGIDDVVVPLNAAATSINAYRLRAALPLHAPVYDANGTLLASLEVRQGDADGSDSSEKLLRALLESAARTITERWFRLIYRRQWIVAAMRSNSPGSAILLAADREQRLAGADRGSRRLLEARGGRFSNGLGVSAFFQCSSLLFRRRSYGDASTMLRACGDGEAWIALITPPDIGGTSVCQDGRAVLHARPRLDSLSRLGSLSAAGQQQRGLPHRALKRVEEYIATHLDSALDVHELAALVHLSSFHFIRLFHKSVGLTPRKYVIQSRVMRARELLATTDLPLTEIALATGFSDQSHFSRRFHELVGVPPRAFRGRDGHWQR